MKDKISQFIPWLLGAGVAAGSTLLSTNCSVPRLGKCGGCGSCLAPLASLVGWAILKKGDGDSPYPNGWHRLPACDDRQDACPTK